MGFVDREHDHIHSLLINTSLDDPNRAVIEAMQQTLVWVNDPDSFMSPTAWLHKFYTIDVLGTIGTGVSSSKELDQYIAP